eukprot:GGOE01041994.1.p1 GENE.GGOE01041994.1~~GGOE01041994.1.p1  ORF type:complete len:166 (-),score=9.85 GGOE01041994.1:57-554(-)
MWLAAQVTEGLMGDVSPDTIDINTKLSNLKGPFCQWLAYTQVKLAADQKNHFAPKPGLFQAWGATQDKLFDESMALHQKNELFGQIHVASTKETVACDPQQVEAGNNNRDGRGNEEPTWDELHDDDLDEKAVDGGDEGVDFPEELTEFCMRRAALSLRVCPKLHY